MQRSLGANSNVAVWRRTVWSIGDSSSIHRERRGVVICIRDGDQSARLLGRTITATGITGTWASSSANRLISML
jgi:hypothetical protein